MNVRGNFKWSFLFFESMVTFLNRLVLYLVLIFHFMTTFLAFLFLGCNAILFTIIRTVEPSFHESPPALISTEENLEGLILARDRD